MMGHITGQPMAETFLAEAQKLLELERGLQTIPTLNALCLMYLTSALLGKDRVGLMYRYMAYGMLKRLDLEQKFARLNDDDPKEIRMKEILSKTLWGIFCFERYGYEFWLVKRAKVDLSLTLMCSRMSYFYSEPSLIRPPSVSKLFDERTEQGDKENQKSSPDSLHRSTPGLFHALCDLSELFYEIMTYNSTASTVHGSTQDFIERAQLYSKLKKWQGSLPKRLQAEENFTVQTCYLQ